MNDPRLQWMFVDLDWLQGKYILLLFVKIFTGI